MCIVIKYLEYFIQSNHSISWMVNTYFDFLKEYRLFIMDTVEFDYV